MKNMTKEHKSITTLVMMNKNYKIYLKQKLKEQRSSANHITEQVRAIMSR